MKDLSLVFPSLTFYFLYSTFFWEEQLFADYLE